MSRYKYARRGKSGYASHVLRPSLVGYDANVHLFVRRTGESGYAPPPFFQALIASPHADITSVAPVFSSPFRPTAEGQAK